MKNSLIKLFIFSGVLGIMIACSTKKDRFINREFQALNTKYNVMYNGNVALDKGIEDLKLQYNDDFWTILPVERMVVSKEKSIPGDEAKNANFERAEEKATKAIQKRSMNIDGREVNPQMDEAHLLLGKSRYYTLRFIPALEAFNYVLYKYPESDRIYEVKIWREKTNMRMENDALAVINLRKLLREIKFKDQIYADANATLAQAFLNLNQKDSAIVKLQRATEYTKSDEEKARYQFITGQLLNTMGQKDSAFAAFQSVIDMKRKSPRRYVIQSHLQQAKAFDITKGDTIAFLENFNELLEDRENRPFLDFINHQLALFYDQQDNHKVAIKYYNTSLKKKMQDQYLVASNYRNLATLYFDDAKYPTAGKYYDSTLTVLDPRSREHKLIKKKRENLEDVIKYEGIAQTNDSILNLVQMSTEDRKIYFEKHIVDLKEQDKIAAEILKKQQEIEQIKQGGMLEEENSAMMSKSMAPPSFDVGPKSTESFYFYNPATVSYGKNEFRKKWGKRTLGDNWRWSDNAKGNASNSDEEETVETSNENEAVAENVEDPRYTTDFYTSQIPSKQEDIAVLIKDRNFAYYQLGTIYKEKFKEYELAADKLEKLLTLNPEERLILPSMYNLYKIYEIINPSKAAAMKQKILATYPDSRYAQIISNEVLNAEQLSQTPEAKYESLYKKYEQNADVSLLEEVEAAIDLYTGDEIVSKFELLKANILGRLKGVGEYKTALNFVALNYPNSQEGKSAEQLLSKNIPLLEKLKFDGEKATSWKLVFNIKDTINANDKILIEKIKKFTTERTAERLSFSVDNYIMNDVLLVVHGIPSESKAKDIVTILQEYKDYLIKEPVFVISTENYKVIQVQKKWDDYTKMQLEVKPEAKTESSANNVNSNVQTPKTEVQPQTSPNTTKSNVQDNSKTEVKPEDKTDKLNPPKVTNETTLPTKKP